MANQSERLKRELEKGCIELSAKMDDSLAHRLVMFSEQLEIPLWLIIQNLLLADWSRRVASFEVEGTHAPRLMPEFSSETLPDGTKEVITGEELFSTLVEIYKQPLILEREIKRGKLQAEMIEHPELESVLRPQLERMGGKPQQPKPTYDPSLEAKLKADAEKASRDIKT